MDALAVDYDYLFKLLVVGDSGVGKSALLVRFADHTFSSNFISTIGVDFKIRTSKTREGQVVKLQIWDTAGQERFQTICQSYYRGAHGIMLTFDTTNVDSFKSVRTWHQEVLRFASSDVRLVLVGTKSDMVGMREVETEQAEEFAQKLGIPYIETSAKQGSRVEEAFRAMTEQCLSSVRAQFKQKFGTPKEEDEVGQPGFRKARWTTDFSSGSSVKLDGEASASSSCVGIKTTCSAS
eukprot:gb/GEZN01015882.1/.p1 GENE.gb/GEZN01015882.1/~~gb/GEZN01015882.1/.p1  ORF type:complete len:248 (+),score=37.76 gb/GEZN01015882.1/:36-746(+)